MTPDAVSSVGGATPSETPATTTGAASPSASSGKAFGDALKVAKAVASAPATGPGQITEAARARAAELGLAGEAGAYDVIGHRYARVEGGAEGGRYVNTSGNARQGQTFDIVRRDGQTFHVYADHVVRVGPAPAAKAEPDAAADAGTTAGGADNTAGGRS